MSTDIDDTHKSYDESKIINLLNELKYLDDEILSKTKELTPSLSTLVEKLSKLDTNLNDSGRTLYNLIKDFNSQKKEEDALRVELIATNEEFKSLHNHFITFEEQSKEILSAQDKFSDYLSTFDKRFVKDEMKKIHEKNLLGIKNTLQEEFKAQKQEQKTMLYYGLGVFLLGITLGATLGALS